MAVSDGQGGQQRTLINDELDSLIGDIARQRGLEESGAAANAALGAAGEDTKPDPSATPALNEADDANAKRQARAAAAVAEAKRREQAAKTQTEAEQSETPHRIDAPVDETAAAPLETPSTYVEEPEDIDVEAIEASFEDIDPAEAQEDTPLQTPPETHMEGDRPLIVTKPGLEPRSDETDSEAAAPTADIIHLHGARPYEGDPSNELFDEDRPAIATLPPSEGAAAETDAELETPPPLALLDDDEPLPSVETPIAENQEIERWDERRLLAPWLAAALPLAAVSTVALAASLSTLFARPADPAQTPATPGDSSEGDLLLTDAPSIGSRAALGDAAGTSEPADRAIADVEAPTPTTPPPPALSAALEAETSRPSDTQIAPLASAAPSPAPVTRSSDTAPTAARISIGAPARPASAPSAKPRPPARLTAAVSLPSPEGTALQNSPSVTTVALEAPPSRRFEGPLPAHSAGARIVALLGASGTVLSDPETTQLGSDINALFETAKDGQTEILSGWGERSVETAFADTHMQVKDVQVARQANMALLPDELVLTHDWLVTEQDTALYAAPQAIDGRDTITVPVDTLLDRMGLFTAPDGKTWNVIASEGVAAAYVPNDAVSLAAKHEGGFSGVYGAEPEATIDQAVSVETECRTGSFNVGPGAADTDVFCRTTQGQWVSDAPTTSATPVADTTLEGEPDDALLAIVFAHERVFAEATTTANWSVDTAPEVRDLAERGSPDQTDMADLLSIEGASLEDPDNVWTVSPEAVSVRALG